MTIRSHPEMFRDHNAAPAAVSATAAASASLLDRSGSDGNNGNDGGYAPGDDVTGRDCGDFVSLEERKHQAAAGGYVRAIAVRLVFLDHVDTRCEVGRPPTLRAFPATTETRPSKESKKTTMKNAEDIFVPSLQDLAFGLKLFRCAGLALLA